MSVTFRVPDYLASFAGQRTSITLADSPHTVGEALALLWQQYPGLQDRMVDEQSRVRPQLNIFVCNDPICRGDGLATSLCGSAEVVVLPAVGIA